MDERAALAAASGRRAWSAAALFRPVAPAAERRFHRALAAVLAAAAAALWLLLRPFAFPLDDAYLTLHNAVVLLDGADPNYAGVAALTGATSPAHLAVVAALTAALGPAAAGFAAALIAAALYAHGLAALALRHGGGPAVAAATVAVGLATGYAPYHLLNGLETGAAMAAAAWALALAGAARPSRALALLCGVMPFIRPELGVLAAALMAHQVLRRGDRRAAALDLALMAAAAAPWLAWSWAATGSLLPSTVAAKAAFFAEQSLPVALKLRALVYGLAASGIGPLLLAVALLRRAPLAWCVWAFVAAMLAAYLVAFPGGLIHNWHRYAYVLLPLAIHSMLTLLRSRRDRLPALLAGAAMAWAAATLPGALRTYGDDRAFTRGEREGVARWVRENLPGDARVLVHDAGHLAFATRLALIDVVGLKTPAAVAEHRAWTAPSAGARRDEAVHRIALRFRPTHAVILDDREGYWSAIAGHLRRHGWRLEVLRAPPGGHGYVVYRVTGHE